MTLPARRGPYSARRLDPFGGLGGFDDLFTQMSRMLTTAFPDVARISVNSWAPPVDVRETAEAYLVEADVPGVTPGDVDVEVHRNELRISGQYGQQGSGEQEGGPTRSGRFDYRVTLPGEADADAGSAELTNGVLKLRLPKASRGRQKIAVQAGDGGPAPADAAASEPASEAQSGGAPSDGGTATGGSADAEGAATSGGTAS